MDIQHNNFQETLQDVNHLPDVSIQYLESMVHQYPWFTKAHQLLAKKYQLTNHQKFNEQLQHAALLSYSRTELFNLIETDIAVKKNIEPVKTEIKIEEKLAEPIKEMKFADVIIENKLPQIKEEIIEHIINVEEEKAEFEPKKLKKLNVFEKEFEIKKIDVSEIKEFEIKKAIVEETKAPIITKVETPKPKTIATEMKVEKENITTPSLNNSKTETPKSFTSWLKKYSKGSKVGEEKAAEPKPITQKKSDFILRIEDGYDDNDENEVDDLKINLAELSSFSMQQHDEFVTETMAKIYVEQEKFDKAISTYEKLSLLKPEKSVFFASRITEIKNKIKQQ